MVLDALVVGAVALAIAAGLWALAQQNVAERLRRTLRIAGARTRAAVGERDALLGAAREALVVWGRDGAGPYSYGGGGSAAGFLPEGRRRRRNSPRRSTPSAITARRSP